MYWLSTRTRNDLFLVYCFADTGVPTARLRETVTRRGLRIPDLRVRVRDAPANLAYPGWVPCAFAEDQFREHRLPTPTWSAATTALAELLGTGLDASHRPWRLHVFRGIIDAPLAPAEPAIVAVLQVSHALADGRRAADIARALFTDSGITDESTGAAGFFAAAVNRVLPVTLADRLKTAVPLWNAALAVPTLPMGVSRTVIRGIAAYRAQRELADLTAAGQLPPPGSGYAPNPLNGDGGAPRHAVRMMVRAAGKTRAPGYTVTIVVLTAVSLAVQRYLAARNEPVEVLGAQVPVATFDRAAGQRNSYGDLSVDLAVAEPDPRLRADRIATDMAARRERARHPLHVAQDRVTAVIPAPILRWDVNGYPIDGLPERVSGHTVVSSVHRGPADLTFGGGAVRFTAGFPALGSVMHLTHGVHGLGDTVTVSVHADPAVIPDLDEYAELLDAALDEVVTALR